MQGRAAAFTMQAELSLHFLVLVADQQVLLCTAEMGVLNHTDLHQSVFIDAI